tara:strand:+ start:193 stop:531 length:339 start_codon:yes stop_codon:yes gene_type:complete
MKNIILILFIFLQNTTSLIQPSNFLSQHPIIAKNTINILTTKLPMLDQFGHKNLEFNEKAIPYILNSNIIPPPIKVEVITDLIMFSQFGDNFGSWILDHYLKIITYLTQFIQ